MMTRSKERTQQSKTGQQVRLPILLQLRRHLVRISATILIMRTFGRGSVADICMCGGSVPMFGRGETFTRRFSSLCDRPGGLSGQLWVMSGRPGSLSGRPGNLSGQLGELVWTAWAPVWAAGGACLGGLGICLGGMRGLLGGLEACLGDLACLEGLEKPNLRETSSFNGPKWAGNPKTRAKNPKTHAKTPM